MTEQIISCKEARASNRSQYFTGKPCRNGHVAPRWVSGRGCIVCQKTEVARWRAKNSEAITAKRRAEYAADPKKYRELARAWRAANIDKARGQARARYGADPEKAKAATLKWRRENRELVNATNRAWRRANKENCSQWWKDWYKTNSEKVRASAKAWRDANPDKAHAAHVAWRSNNPEKLRAQSINRRALKKASGGVITAADITTKLRLQRHKCLWCLKPLKNKYHADHHMALANGGANEPSNIFILCPKCNLEKNAKPVHVFAQERGLLVL